MADDRAKIAEFEKAVADFTGAKEGVAVNSGTAALHAAMFAIGIEPGDEVIVPTMTFAATANCVLYQDAKPVLVDVLPESLLIDPAAVEAAITPHTKAIIGVDYAGHPCNLGALRQIADRHGLILVEDACHSLGAEYSGKKIGRIADLTCFSFHPVKHITTGEGGMTLTHRPEFAERMRRFRNHGISSDQRQRTEQGTWFYEMVDLGFNYRITDFQCALGMSQLAKLPGWLQRRRSIAGIYDAELASLPYVTPLRKDSDILHAYHLYVVKIDFSRLGRSRKEVFLKLRSQGIGVNVHYIPVHLHPYYQQKLGYRRGSFPVAEAVYEQILSLPMYATLKDEEIARVMDRLKEITQTV